MQLKFRDGPDEHTLVVRRHDDGWLVATDGAQDAAPNAATVRPAGDGAWLVTLPDGSRRRAWVAARGDERLVFCDGVTHRLRRPDPVHAEGADPAQADGPDLLARMPGKIVRLLVAPGQAVAAGQPLLIMESMKMETELAAPQAGLVERVVVGEGQVVAQGDLLVAVTPAPAG
jgi:3-methylcrotonyl-CoA carboxylase alpha subunit